MRERRMLSGALRRMQMFQLSRAWERWQWYYAQVMAARGGWKPDDILVSPSKSSPAFVPVDTETVAVRDVATGDVKNHPKDTTRVCSPKKRRGWFEGM